MTIIEKAPAKINLTLDALFKHDDGHHEWNMIMSSIDLADYVTLTPSKNKSIQITTDNGFLPLDRRNLAYQAARLLQTRFGIDQGANIHIEKHIPVAAGLGGGSSDAAAVLRGLNKMWHLNLSDQELSEIGLNVDSDVPYCVYSHTAYVTGKGEKIEPLPAMPPCWIILAKPKISVSTPRVLRHINYDAIKRRPDNKAVINGLFQQNFSQMISGMYNVLEDITSRRYTEIRHLEKKMRFFGASVAQMSGSGPTVFGLCQKESKAQRIFNSMQGFCPEVYMVRQYNRDLNN